jgi:HK97 family phage prohead protease
VAGVHEGAGENKEVSSENRKELRYAAKELRASGSGSERKISGYAAKFGVLSDNLGGFREVLKPGCFTRTLSLGADVRMLVDHEPSKILGRTKAGTLTLRQDNVGLHFDCTLPDTQIARDVHENIRIGNISDCSFGFYCVDEDFSEDPQRGLIRTVSDLDLFDCSVVTFPAYPNTEVNARSLWPEGKPVYLEPAAIETRCKKLGIHTPSEHAAADAAVSKMEDALGYRLAIHRMMQ